MIIGLLGFEFESSNKGCEALTFALFPVLEKTFKNSHIVVFNIHDSLGYIPSIYSDFSFDNIKIQMKKPSFWKLLREKIRKCDVILDITHGDSFSDIYGMKWFIKTSLIKQLVLDSGTPLILMPQTYGPFNSKLAFNWAKKIIRKANRVYTRDNISKDYLINKMSISRDSVFNTSDMAFALPYNPEKLNDDNIKVGINVSGLLWTKDEMDNNKISLTVNYKEYCNKLIDWLNNNDGYSVYLIPHVICDEREGLEYYDNDCVPSKELKDTYANCIFRSDFDTAIDVKNYIAAMDVLIAARMHASIGAYSAGVCSIPFAYSRKFAGVYDDLSYKYIIDGTALNTDDAVNKTIEFIKQYKEIQAEIQKGMRIVKNKSNNFVSDLEKTLEKI